MNSLIECSVYQTHSSTVVPLLYDILEHYDCSWYSFYETRGVYRKFIRNHCVITIECFESKIIVRQLLKRLKSIPHLHIETWYNLQEQQMVYASTHYRKHQLYKDNGKDLRTRKGHEISTIL